MLLTLSLTVCALLVALLAQRAFEHLGRRILLSKIPTLSLSHNEHRPGASTELYHRGYEKYSKNGVLFKVPIRASGGFRVMLPKRYLEEVKTASDKDLNLRMELDEMALMRRHVGIVFRGATSFKIINSDLTRNLGHLLVDMEEANVASWKRVMPPCPDWTAVKPYSMFPQIVAAISARMFVGKELSQNQEWLDLSMGYALTAFGAISETRQKYGPWTLWLAKYRSEQISKVIQLREVGRKLLMPVFEKREEEAKDPKFEKPKDAIQWLLDSAAPGETKEDLVNYQMRNTLASIHTTAMALQNILMDLLANPQYIDELQKEAEIVRREEGGSTKNGMARLKKLDSFMKESQRMNPTFTISTQRRVMRSYTFRDGLKLPAGANIAFCGYEISRDPDAYGNPDQFDGYRYLKLRERSHENNNMYQYVSTSPDAQMFGQGAHACPGRFFAGNEIKLVVSHLLQHYDFKWNLEARPKSSVDDVVMRPDIGMEVLFRERR